MEKETPEEIYQRLTRDWERTMQVIAENVSLGVSLFDLCSDWGVSYGRIHQWLASDPDRHFAYQAALEASIDFTRSAVNAELRRIATFDLRQLYDRKGDLLPPEKWPKDIAKAVAACDTHEIFNNDGDKTGESKKVRMSDKIRALELLGKTIGMFTDKIDLGLGVTSIAGALTQARDTVLKKEEKKNSESE